MSADKYKRNYKWHDFLFIYYLFFFGYSLCTSQKQCIDSLQTAKFKGDIWRKNSAQKELLYNSCIWKIPNMPLDQHNYPTFQLYW